MGWFEHVGNRIYYEEEGGGDTVFMMPGWGVGGEDFAPIRQALASRYRVITVDAPGAGRSSPQPRTYTSTYFEDDARAFFALLDSLNALPAHLIGFSDGGEYALLMAASRPSAVRSILTWGAAGKLVEPMPGMIEAFAHLIDNPIPQLKPFSDYLVATYGDANAGAMCRSEAAALAAILEAGGDISLSRANEITCPALIITGSQDFLVPPSLASATAKVIPRGKFIEATEAGHDVHHARPEWFLQTVNDWLDEG